MVKDKITECKMYSFCIIQNITIEHITMLFMLKIVDVKMNGKNSEANSTKGTTEGTKTDSSMQYHVQGKVNTKRKRLNDYFIHVRMPREKYKMYVCENCNATDRGVGNYNSHKNICMKVIFLLARKKKPNISSDVFNKHLPRCAPKCFPCTICHKRFSLENQDTNNHEKTHQVQKTFLCHLCACQFLTGKQLNMHI